MHRKTRLKVNPSLNPHLICVLCGGYLIDATTIVECLHSFCKTCIVRYLESSKFCPICDVQVHKTKPFTNIRLDHTLQDLVYKLVPGLFQNEMKRRRDFYRDQGLDVDSMWDDPDRPEYYTDDDGEIQRERVIFAEDEQISLALQLSPDGKPPRIPSKCTGTKDKEAEDCRYLLCPAAVTIGLLKKFIRLKFSLNDRYQIDIYHTDEVLSDSYTLVDIAYIYMWRRKGPLCLYYTVYTNPAKRFKRDLSCTEKVIKESVTVETEIKNDVEDGKAEKDKDDKSEEVESEKPQSLLSLQETVSEPKIHTPSEKPILNIDASELTNDRNGKPAEPSSDTAETSVPKNDGQPQTSNAPKPEPQEKEKISSETDKRTPAENGFEVAKTCSDKGSNKTKANPVGLEKTQSNGLSFPPSTVNKSPGKKDKSCSSKAEKQLQTQSLKPSSAILVVPTSENSLSVNRIPKLKLNTSKYSSQGIVTKKATLTTPVYHPRVTQKTSLPPTDLQGAEKTPSSEKIAKKMCTQNGANSSSSDKGREKKTDSPKSSPSKKSASDKTTTGTPTKPSPTAKHKLLQTSSTKNVSNTNAKNAKSSASKSSIIGAKTSSTTAAPNVNSKQENRFTTNGQKLRLTVPYSSYGCYTNGLTIPSPMGFSPTVTSPRPFSSSPLNRPLSTSPTRRKTSSPSRRVPSTTPNGRLTPGSCVSPSSLYSLSPSPTNRSFPTSPSPHSFNPAARMIPTSPLARHISSSTGRIFSFPDRGPPISHLPITVPAAHSHLNLRLNTSPLYSNNASPHNGDLPQDLSIKKKTSNDESKTPSSTLKIPIKVPIKTNGLPSSEIDKFAFTDDDEDISPLGSRKLHPIKAEPGSGL
ncbi:polycomb group protein Psc-like [Ostrea edulis]|uniref:polycomb group protein Psc-like n=1 Tax=Ostrea edulis TaxID=37623 RepID=UPI0024AF87BA|nr:polycomb group protein Psc-like [Ostrea edulis]XP_048756042.2 polycomb group protein Psc-like [Ostrea edulis]XP_056007887.1 polycomb group protein Psc-like [Ostrea edulis]